MLRAFRLPNLGMGPAWVLIGDDYHFIIETPSANLVAGMAWLQTPTRDASTPAAAPGDAFSATAPSPSSLNRAGATKPAATHTCRPFSTTSTSIQFTKVFVYEGNDPKDESRLIFSIQRGFTLFRSKVRICDAQGNVIGGLKSKLFSLGGAFWVFDSAGQQVAMVKGDWKGWNFRLLDNSENEIGTITKKWAGLGKELFTSADNYVIALTQEPKPSEAILLLAAGLAVDTVYKER